MAMAISVPLYTVDDLPKFPDDGNRYELLDGVLLVTPAPAAIHQLLASRIQVKLSIALQETGLAEVLSRSSQVYDREFKRDAYFALGVQQVWLVDWRERCVEVCRAPRRTRRVRDVIRWHVRAANVTVTLKLSEIFAGI